MYGLSVEVQPRHPWAPWSHSCCTSNTHVGTQTYCFPSRCIKWGPAGPQLSLGPSLLQWKIPARCRGITGVAGPLYLLSLHPLSRQQSSTGTVWPQETLGIWRHFWLAAPGRHGAVASSRCKPRVLLNIFKGIAQPLPEQDHLAKMPIAGWETTLNAQLWSSGV